MNKITKKSHITNSDKTINFINDEKLLNLHKKHNNFFRNKIRRYEKGYITFKEMVRHEIQYINKKKETNKNG